MEKFTAKDRYGADEPWVIPTDAADVTDEILDLSIDTVDGWFPEGPIEWESVWDRMEGSLLADGTKLSWGSEFDTPAMRKVQREVRKHRAQG